MFRLRAFVLPTLLAAVLALSACSGSADQSGGPEAQAIESATASTSPTPVPVETVAPADRAGVLFMAGTLAIGQPSDGAGGGFCIFLESEINFSDDNQLLLKSGSGETVGIGELGEFVYSEEGGTRTCMRTFIVPQVAVDEDFYFFTFGGQTSPTFPATILETSIPLWNVPTNKVEDSLSQLAAATTAPPAAPQVEGAASAPREQQLAGVINSLNSQTPEDRALLCEAWATYPLDQVVEAMMGSVPEKDQIPADVINEGFAAVCTAS